MTIMKAHIQLKIDKNLSEADLAHILLNICEHIATERNGWTEKGILDSPEQIKPIVLPISLLENLHKEINRNIEEGALQL